MTEQVEVQEVAPNSADVLKAAVEETLANSELDRNGKLEAIQGAFEAYAQAVKAEVDAVAPPDPGEAIQKALLPVIEKLELIAQKMGQAPAQTPQQKSFVPKGDVTPEPALQKPPSIAEIARRSVGIH